MIRRLPPKEKKEIEEFREAFFQKTVFFEKLFQKMEWFFEKVLKFREKSAISHNNEEVKPKRVYTKAQQKASKVYHEKNKDNEEYKQKNREKAKRSYEKNKEYIIARVRANQRRVQELKQLEKLHELKEQGLITFEKLSLKDNHELLDNLEILGM